MKRLIIIALWIILLIFLIDSFIMRSFGAEVEKPKETPKIILPRARGNRRISNAITCYPTRVLSVSLAKQKLKLVWFGAEIGRSPMGSTPTAVLQLYQSRGNEFFILVAQRPGGYSCVLSRGMKPTINLSEILDTVGDDKRKSF